MKNWTRIIKIKLFELQSIPRKKNYQLLIFSKTKNKTQQFEFSKFSKLIKKTSIHLKKKRKEK